MNKRQVDVFKRADSVVGDEIQKEKDVAFVGCSSVVSQPSLGKKVTEKDVQRGAEPVGNGWFACVYVRVLSIVEKCCIA